MEKQPIRPRIDEVAQIVNRQRDMLIQPVVEPKPQGRRNLRLWALQKEAEIARANRIAKQLFDEWGNK